MICNHAEAFRRLRTDARQEVRCQRKFDVTLGAEDVVTGVNVARGAVSRATCRYNSFRSISGRRFELAELLKDFGGADLGMGAQEPPDVLEKKTFLRDIEIKNTLSLTGAGFVGGFVRCPGVALLVITQRVGTVICALVAVLRALCNANVFWQVRAETRSSAEIQ